MQLHLGFSALAGLAVAAVAASTPAASAQCGAGGYYGSGSVSTYYTPAPAATYYAPSYAPQYCAPPTYYSQPTYSSYSVNVGIGSGHCDYGQWSRRHGDWSHRHDRDRGHWRGHDRSRNRHR